MQWFINIQKKKDGQFHGIGFVLLFHRLALAVRERCIYTLIYVANGITSTKSVQKCSRRRPKLNEQKFKKAGKTKHLQ
jgi:hypothetical protein